MIDTNSRLKTWIIPGLFWGVSMCLVMPIIDGELMTWKQLYTLPIWLTVGLVMQYFLSKWIYKKRRQ